MRFPRPIAAVLVLVGLAAATATAQERLSWDAGCGAIHDQLGAALAEAPEMALGNRSKVERLLRDARNAQSEQSCQVNLRHAYELLQRGYADAGQELDVMAGQPRNVIPTPAE
jgi:hypothetical protein